MILIDFTTETTYVDPDDDMIIGDAILLHGKCRLGK